MFIKPLQRSMGNQSIRVNPSISRVNLLPARCAYKIFSKPYTQSRQSNDKQYKYAPNCVNNPPMQRTTQITKCVF
jgi:hypothetical protein